MSLELLLQVAYRISILSEDEYFVVRMLRRKKPDEGIEFCIFVDMPPAARLNYLEQRQHICMQLSANFLLKRFGRSHLKRLLY